MLLYKVEIDGTYSTITKFECSDSLAKELLNDTHTDYFKTFAGAKKELIKYITGMTNQWKYALSNAKSLQSTDTEQI